MAANPKITLAIQRTISEIYRLNKMLDEELPDCPKLRINGFTSIGDTPRLIAEFNVDFREYILKLGITSVLH